MPLRNINEGNFANKTVLVRVDLNIELSNIGDVQEHFKLEVAKKTLDYILGFSGVKVALLTHYGRPEGKRNTEYSVKQLIPIIKRVLGRDIVFVDDCVGEKVEQTLSVLPEGSVLLLENARFYPEEEKNDLSFAEMLARPFALYVNEAFSVCHRTHASVVGITQFLPSFAGLRVLEEIKTLDQVRLKLEHPAVAIIGGAKIETKLPLIRAFEENYDAILVGGKIANEALDQGTPFSDKVLLPKDFDSPMRLDIGPNTIAYYIQIIKMAKTIIWNGPLGKFEEKPYDTGTDAVLHAILESKAYVVIGGGESLAMLEKADAIKKISFVSSGGGAMLEYMSGKKLPGLEALEAK